MKINSNSKILLKEVTMEGAKGVRMKMLVGADDGSVNIFMRHFVIAPGGNTPYHTHDYEHVVKVEKNSGVIVDESGNEHKIKKGHSIFVKPGEKHQFRNPFGEDFEFTCIIPNPDKK